MKDLALWDAPLEPQQVKDLYYKGLTGTETVDAALDFLTPPLSSSLLLPGSISSESGDSYAESESAITYPTRLWDRLWGTAFAHNSDPFSANDVEMGEVLLQEGKEKALDCAPVAERMDLYRQAAADYGNAEALFNWGMVMIFGSESSDLQCGYVDGQAKEMSSVAYNRHSRKGNKRVITLLSVPGGASDDHRNSTEGTDSIVLGEEEYNQVRGMLSLLIAFEHGHVEALMPLTSLLASGIGILPLLLPLDRQSALETYDIPWHSSQSEYTSSSSCDATDDSSYDSRQGCTGGGGDSRLGSSYMLSLLQSKLLSAVTTCESHQSNTSSTWRSYTPNTRCLHPADVYCLSHSSRPSDSKGTSDMSKLTVGLMHIAALFHSHEAYAALSYRYLLLL